MRMNFNGHCFYREVAILENKLRLLFGVNVWTVIWEKKNGCCREVTISGGSTDKGNGQPVTLLLLLKA